MSDPNTKVKTRQNLIMGGCAVGILGLLGAGMFIMEPAPKQAKQKPVQVSLTPPGSVDDKDAWRASEGARAKSNETNIQALQAKLKAQEEEGKRVAKELDELKARGASAAVAAASASTAAATSKPVPISAEKAAQVLDKPLPGAAANSTRVLQSPLGKPGVLNQPINGGGQQQPAKPDPVEMITFGKKADGQPGSGAEKEQGDPQVLGFPVNEKATTMAKPADAKDSKGIEFIPAGSFVRVFMLNGVDAPTGGQAQSNPLPMAFEVLDTANLANKYRLDIRECRFIAAAWGDLSSERTMGRTETLTCVIGGKTVEIPVKGTVIGEDGKAGMRGRLVTKQGQLLANALFAGSLSGIGKAFQAAATTTTSGGGGVTQTIDPDQVGAAALGGGVSSAANMLATYYLKAADKLFPVIETDGGRVVEILITKGAVYKGDGAGRDEHRALMRRNGSTARNNQDD